MTENSTSAQKSEREQAIEYVNEIEGYIFYRLQTSFASPLRTVKPALLSAPNMQVFKKEVYELLDQGIFKESEADREKRESPIKYHVEDQSVIHKHPDEMLPTHFHDLLSAIRDFNQLLDTDVSDQEIEKQRKYIFKIFANHIEGLRFKHVVQDKNLQTEQQSNSDLDSQQNLTQDHSVSEPEIQLEPQQEYVITDYKYLQRIHEILNKIEKIQLSNLSHDLNKLKDALYKTWLENFYLKYKDNKESLWVLLGLTQNNIKELKTYSQHILNENPEKKLSSAEIRELKKNHYERFEFLTNYINKIIFPELQRDFSNNYKRFINNLTKNIHQINQVSGQWSWNKSLEPRYNMAIKGLDQIIHIDPIILEIVPWTLTTVFEYSNVIYQMNKREIRHISPLNYSHGKPSSKKSRKKTSRFIRIIDPLTLNKIESLKLEEIKECVESKQCEEQNECKKSEQCKKSQLCKKSQQCIKFRHCRVPESQRCKEVEVIYPGPFLGEALWEEIKNNQIRLRSKYKKILENLIEARTFEDNENINRKKKKKESKKDIRLNRLKLRILEKLKLQRLQVFRKKFKLKTKPPKYVYSFLPDTKVFLNKHPELKQKLESLILSET
ncbi:MAG: hypothetical protein GX151_12060 [Gammaproteobacteria bacterium]|jgi:hypothetical protein|uniref:hypothetical protein n=1 Tax=unclassified Acinetobacter TaxID=196816 RepID=UPI0015D33BFD|nr:MULTISPECIES: hypothetical protein [unclassified Acinetobacter]NLN58629.1 hypothetical protein [Gammaproteobacteria bacterium]